MPTFHMKHELVYDLQDADSFFFSSFDCTLCISPPWETRNSIKYRAVSSKACSPLSYCEKFCTHLEKKMEKKKHNNRKAESRTPGGLYI